jgi:hypothetical protein
MTNNTIHKFQLGMAEKAIVKMPDRAKIIRVDGIDGFLYIWAVVDTERPIVNREFLLFKTGASMPEDILENYNYLGCGGIFVQMELMMYVWEHKDA